MNRMRKPLYMSSPQKFCGFRSLSFLTSRMKSLNVEAGKMAVLSKKKSPLILGSQAHEVSLFVEYKHEPDVCIFP